MPHDAKGRPLKSGDQVMVPFTVEQVSEGEEFCNLTLKSVLGMPPHGGKMILSINTVQVIRCNAGDPAVDPVTADDSGDSGGDDTRPPGPSGPPE